MSNLNIKKFKNMMWEKGELFSKDVNLIECTKWREKGFKKIRPHKYQL